MTRDSLSIALHYGLDHIEEVALVVLEPTLRPAPGRSARPAVLSWGDRLAQPSVGAPFHRRCKAHE
jgi:hypothetical protein